MPNDIGRPRIHRPQQNTPINLFPLLNINKLVGSSSIDTKFCYSSWTHIQVITKKKNWFGGKESRDGTIDYGFEFPL